jgi:hypothetical protein
MDLITTPSEKSMSFVPTFSVYSSETDPLPLRTGFATLREAIVYADTKRKRYVIRRSVYIAGYANDGIFHRGMIVHNTR